MRSIAFAGVVAIVVLTGDLLVAQQPRMKPTEPGTKGDPVWQGVLRTADGRTFVTDGGLVIDAALAKPATRPDRELPPNVLEGYFNAAHKEEYGFSDFKPAASRKTYTAPNGIALNATYVDFLRRTLPIASARFRMREGLQPIVIVVDGKAVGALMPVKQ